MAGQEQMTVRAFLEKLPLAAAAAVKNTMNSDPHPEYTKHHELTFKKIYLPPSRRALLEALYIKPGITPETLVQKAIQDILEAEGIRLVTYPIEPPRLAPPAAGDENAPLNIISAVVRPLGLEAGSVNNEEGQRVVAFSLFTAVLQKCFYGPFNSFLLLDLQIVEDAGTSAEDEGGIGPDPAKKLKTDLKFSLIDVKKFLEDMTSGKFKKQDTGQYL